jgi:hypothetical protein
MNKIPILSDWKDVSEYLIKLRDTVINDIQPLLSTVGAAPFAISREVLCYIDHLSHLYTGKIEVGQRFSIFLKEVASKIDPNYNLRAEEIYRMYRNGAVHEFEPKTLENNKGELLFWLCYRGERIESLNIEGTDYKVTHLVPCGNNGRYWLPISTKCLIEDLIEFINVFIQSGPEEERRTFWNRAARNLNNPVAFDFKILP